LSTAELSKTANTDKVEIVALISLIGAFCPSRIRRQSKNTLNTHEPGGCPTLSEDIPITQAKMHEILKYVQNQRQRWLPDKQNYLVSADSNPDRPRPIISLLFKILNLLLLLAKNI